LELQKETHHPLHEELQQQSHQGIQSPSIKNPVHGPSIFKKPEYGKRVQYAFVDQS
jgi:hypothetical protein